MRFSPSEGLNKLKSGIEKRRFYAIGRAAFAVVAIVAIVAQFTRSFDDPFLTPGSFFFLFTYQSNVAAAAVLLIGAWKLWRVEGDSPRWDFVRGAIVTYMATTGIVHATLPTSANDTGIVYNYPWATDVLHQLMPLVVFLDWLIVPPAHRLAIKRAALWTLYPLAFCAVSLLRGPFVDWYPYPFLDPREEAGWAGVGIYTLAIAVGFLVFSAIVVAIGNAARQWWAGRSTVVSSPRRQAG